MKKGLSKLHSVQNFRKELDETYDLITALVVQIIATKEFLDFTKARERPGYDEFSKYLNISDHQILKIHELGFISFFSNFECFMFEFTKDLFKKYPGSIKSDKTLKFEDIKDFKEISEIRDYYIDSLAIDKSYDIDIWSRFIYERFKIKIFSNSKDLARLKALNSLRNIILHSGSKTNSKFRNEMRLFLKSPVPLGKPLSLDMKKFFNILHNTFKKLILNIEKY